MTDLLSVDWTKIPPPVDDGGAEHLTGMSVPSVTLAATDGRAIDLSELDGTVVVYAYPMTGQPNVALPEGWDMIPGARGCTPQSCKFRDHYGELKSLGVGDVFGLSSQSAADQKEAAQRLHLPFPLLSDNRLSFATALQLPTFEVGEMCLLKRLTMVLSHARIVKVFYPVFPPDRSARDVMDWLQQNH